MEEAKQWLSKISSIIIITIMSFVICRLQSTAPKGYYRKNLVRTVYRSVTEGARVVLQSEGPIVDKSPTRKLEVSVDETG